MKLIQTLVFFFFISLSFPVLASETDMPAPDNPIPVRPMTGPDNPGVPPLGLNHVNKNSPLLINSGDLTIEEMEMLKKFCEKKLHRKVQFQKK